MRGTVRATLIAALFVGLVFAGCGDDDDSGSGSGSINVAIVDNPQMKDIAKLTPSLFTKKSGIKVNYTILDEGTLREVTTRDVAAGRGRTWAPGSPCARSRRDAPGRGGWRMTGPRRAHYKQR